MNRINYTEELLNKDIPSEILLYYEIQNDNYHPYVIYKYKIYGETFQKLFKLCNEDFDTLDKCLSTIDQCEYITIEIVHVNLNFDTPIPFIKNIDKNVIFDDVEIYEQGKKFLVNYDIKLEDTLNEHKTLFPR